MSPASMVRKHFTARNAVWTLSVFWQNYAAQRTHDRTFVPPGEDRTSSGTDPYFGGQRFRGRQRSTDTVALPGRCLRNRLSSARLAAGGTSRAKCKGDRSDRKSTRLNS